MHAGSWAPVYENIMHDVSHDSKVCTNMHAAKSGCTAVMEKFPFSSVPFKRNGNRTEIYTCTFSVPLVTLLARYVLPLAHCVQASERQVFSVLSPLCCLLPSTPAAVAYTVMCLPC